MWWTEEDGIRKQKSTGLSKSEFTWEQAQSIIDKASGRENENKKNSYTLSWFRQKILERALTEGLRESTIEEHRKALNHLINIYSAEYSIMEIGRSSVRRIQEYLINKGNQPPTINKILRHLRGSFERLVDDEILEKNPFRKFKALHEQQQAKALSDGDLSRFIETVNKSPNEAGRRLVYLYLYTGARRKEILSVEQQEIDTVSWTMQIMNVKDRQRVKRTITVHPDIREHVEYFLANNSSQYPFNICKPDTITHWIKAWMREAGLDERYHLHSLRHTFATRAVSRGNSTYGISRNTWGTQLSW